MSNSQGFGVFASIMLVIAIAAVGVFVWAFAHGCTELNVLTGPAKAAVCP